MNGIESIQTIEDWSPVDRTCRIMLAVLHVKID